jgi:predicted dienelactone hydrolase
LYNNGSLSSLRIQNCSFNNPSTYTYGGYNLLVSGGAELSLCNFNAAALDQIYTDLAAGDGYLLVSNNTGTSTDNPSIATAKGYTVLGS